MTCCKFFGSNLNFSFLFRFSLNETFSCSYGELLFVQNRKKVNFQDCCVKMWFFVTWQLLSDYWCGFVSVNKSTWATETTFCCTNSSKTKHFFRNLSWPWPKLSLIFSRRENVNDPKMEFLLTRMIYFNWTGIKAAVGYSDKSMFRNLPQQHQLASANYQETQALVKFLHCSCLQQN